MKSNPIDYRRLSRRGLIRGATAYFLVAGSRGLAASSASVEPAPTSFEAVVRRRAMIRAYTDVPVPEAKIMRLLSYATRAPSAGNLQPWEFVIVRNPDVRARLAEASGGQESVAGAPVIIVTCGDVERAGRKYGPRGAFFSLVDTAFASLLILLGAVEQGLGACFVGSYDPTKVAEILGLPSHVHPVGLITIGYPGEKPRKPPNPRIPVKKVIHTDHW